MRISIRLNRLVNQHYIDLTCPINGTHQLIYDTEQGEFKIELRGMDLFPRDNLRDAIINQEELYQTIRR